MDGMIMSRNSRLDREAEGLWRAMSNDPPPKGLHGSELLSAAMKLSPPGQYDRLHSAHLRPTQIVRPR